MAIIIQVEGGVIQAVFSEQYDDSVPDIIVMDYDDDSEDGLIIGEQIVDPLDPNSDIAKDLEKWRNAE